MIGVARKICECISRRGRDQVSSIQAFRAIPRETRPRDASRHIIERVNWQSACAKPKPGLYCNLTSPPSIVSLNPTETSNIRRSSAIYTAGSSVSACTPSPCLMAMEPQSETSVQRT